MRKADIKLNSMYSDGKGNVRTIIDEGPHCRLYRTVENPDGVRYRVDRKSSRSPMPLGAEENMTRAQFARWAKFESDVNGQALES